MNKIEFVLYWIEPIFWNKISIDKQSHTKLSLKNWATILLELLACINGISSSSSNFEEFSQLLNKNKYRQWQICHLQRSGPVYNTSQAVSQPASHWYMHTSDDTLVSFPHSIFRFSAATVAAATYICVLQYTFSLSLSLWIYIWITGFISILNYHFALKYIYWYIYVYVTVKPNRHRICRRFDLYKCI